MALNMFIQCPACSTRYEMPDGSIKAEGRKVRCASCKNVWQAYDTPKVDIPSIELQDIELQDIELQVQNIGQNIGQNTAPVLSDSDVNSVMPRVNLKVERTTDDDLMASADEVLDNSQDDIDALFDTPSAEEFGGVLTEEPIIVAPKPVTRIGAIQNWFADKTHKRRELKASRQALRSVEVLESAKASRTAKNTKKSKKLPLAASAAALIFVTLGLGVIYRESVVTSLPQSAKLYQMVGLPVNLRGVIIQNVSSHIVLEQGNPELTIEGEITNVTRQSAKLSRLRFAIRSENGREIYSWKATADKPILESGESIKFRRKLSAPPEEGHDVLVRFETKGDVIAGVQ